MEVPCHLLVTNYCCQSTLKQFDNIDKEKTTFGWFYIVGLPDNYYLASGNTTPESRPLSASVPHPHSSRSTRSPIVTNSLHTFTNLKTQNPHYR